MMQAVGNYSGYPAGGHVGKDGSAVPIYVTDQGQWVAQVGEKVITDWQRSGLLAQIDKLTKRKVVKVSIPITRVERRAAYQGGGLVRRDGVLTGVHSANDNVLVTWTINGREMKEQITGGGQSKNDGMYFERLTKEQGDELAKLVAAKAAADKAYRDFVNEHGVSVKERVLAELDNAKE